MDSGVDELDLSCDASVAAAGAGLDEDEGHGLPSLTSTGTATRFGGDEELFCAWSWCVDGFWSSFSRSF